jgi:hypothetical protein
MDGQAALFWIEFWLAPTSAVFLFALPIWAAFARKHPEKLAILGLVIICWFFEEFHMLAAKLDNDPTPIAQWPMVGWIATYVWACSTRAKLPLA